MLERTSDLNAPMDVLPLAGVILLGLWFVETIVFLVSYRLERSS